MLIMNGYRINSPDCSGLQFCYPTRSKNQAHGNSKVCGVASQNLNVPSADTVAFGLGYMVTLGRSEAEGVGMEFCQILLQN
jgi:hypothetical protein